MKESGEKADMAGQNRWARVTVQSHHSLRDAKKARLVRTH
jgi:hypothetical protein